MRVTCAALTTIFFASGLGFLPLATIFNTNTEPSLKVGVAIFTIGLSHTFGVVILLWGWMVEYHQKPTLIGGALMLLAGIVCVFFPPNGTWIGVISILIGVVALVKAARN